MIRRLVQMGVVAIALFSAALLPASVSAAHELSGLRPGDVVVVDTSECVLPLLYTLSLTGEDLSPTGLATHGARSLGTFSGPSPEVVIPSDLAPVQGVGGGPLRPGTYVLRVDGVDCDHDIEVVAGDPAAFNEVAVAVLPSGVMLVTDSQGAVLSYGTSPFGAGTSLAEVPGISLNSPIVGMGVTPSGGGYWLVGADGGVFAFGDAVFVGSLGGVSLVSPVVGMGVTPSGGGYWRGC